MDKILAAPLAIPHIIGRMLVQSRTIVFCKPITVKCKVNRHIIHDRAYSILVERIYQKLQIVRSAISGSWAEKSCVLISPGLITRMLRKGHKFNIVISLFLQIFHQQGSNLSICIPALRYSVCLYDLLRCKLSSALIIHRLTMPRTEMHLIYIQRASLTLIPALHPSAVAKAIRIHIPYNRCKCRSQFHPEPIRITVIYASAISLVYLVFVHLSHLCSRHKALEKSPVVAPFHLSFPPAIEFSCHRHRLRIRRICDKINPNHNLPSILS